MVFDGTLIFVSVITLCLYNVWIKESTDKLVFLFWVNLFTYLVFIAIFLGQKHFIQDDHDGLIELAELTYDDWPLYMIIAISFVVSMVTLEHLFDKYDLSLVSPMSQLSILTASAGYMALGDPFQWSLVVGIVILFIGSYITSLSVSEGSVSNDFIAQLKNVSGPLWALIAVQVLCHTVSAIVSYIGTKDTEYTEYILNSLRHLHVSPVTFFSAFEFNIGNQFFSISLLAIYLLSREKYRRNLFSPIVNNLKMVTIATLAYLISMYTYLEAFSITEETTILLALNNFTIPITFLFSYMILKEHISTIKITGASLIVLGALVTVLF